MATRRSPENQEKEEKAFRDVMEGGGVYFAHTYLSEAVLSGQYSCNGLQAIAAGIERALKEKGYR